MASFSSVYVYLPQDSNAPTWRTCSSCWKQGGVLTTRGMANIHRRKGDRLPEELRKIPWQPRHLSASSYIKRTLQFCSGHMLACILLSVAAAAHSAGEPQSGSADEDGSCIADATTGTGPRAVDLTFGRHRPPIRDQSSVVERNSWPTPATFNREHDHPRIPLAVRGGGAALVPKGVWSDEHLSTVHGATEVYAEIGKLEDRQNNGVHLPLSSFIDRYKAEELYVLCHATLFYSGHY